MHNYGPSRRTFLKSSFIAGAGLVPSVLLANDATDYDDRITDEKGLVFLFQGDSITDGARGRTADPNHIMGHGYAFAVASRIGANLPDRNFQFYNRGISGNRVPHLQKRWEADAIAITPDVVSILIGINDTALSVEKPATALSVEDFETGYRDLLQQSKQANPDVLFVIGVPFVFRVGKRAENWNRWNEETTLRQQVVYKIATEFNAVVVDYPAVFNKATNKAPIDYWIWDGIHPTVFGHELMAREWIKQVSKRLKFLRHYKKIF